MNKSCSYCGRVHPVGFVCDKQPKRRRFKKETGAIAEYRNSNRRKEIHKRVKMRDLHLCRVCLDGAYNDYRGILGLRPLLEVHHITPLAEDITRRDDVDNLITLCRMHHEQAERGEIEREYLYNLAKTEPKFWQG